MTFVEQAVFTSAVTDRSAGYHVVAQSPGVCEADVRELAVWCPSHDSLLEWGPDAESFNFHPLPSGGYCISRTTPAGWEYSGRGGHRIYTHCLLVPRDVLARFANNPFSVIRAATAGGMFALHQRVPARLEPLVLAGSAVPVDQNLLARLAANPGPRAMARLVQAARDTVCLALSGEPSAGELMAGLFSCLPPPCRTEFSFSTGLKFSGRRPFRLIAMSDDPAEQRWLAHQHNVQLLDLRAEAAANGTPLDGWSQWIARVLATGRTSFLATQLSKRRFDLKADDLPALGLQLLEDFEAVQMQTDHSPDDRGTVPNDRGTVPIFAQRKWDCPLPERDEQHEWDCPLPERGEPDPHADSPDLEPGPSSSDAPLPPAELPAAASERRQGHAPHRQFAKTAAATAPTTRRCAGPAAQLTPDSPEVLAKLEHLDDVVYEAIDGRPDALAELETLWPKLLSELGEDLVAESRAQYLRYALSVWEDTAESSGVREPARAVTALDVLSVLFDKG